MTDLTDMWEALEAHQHMADHHGYGEAWARMCKERTAAYAVDASGAVDAVDAAAAYGAAWDASRAAAYAAAYYAGHAAAANAAAANAAAGYYAGYAAEAVYHSKRAITYITKANDGLAYVHSLLNEGEKM